MYSVEIGSRAEVGSSSSSTSGPTASARARHSNCCWPPERRNGESPRRSLTASHRPTSRESLLGHHIELLSLGDPVGLDAGDHVVADRHRKGVGPLEQHADAATEHEEVVVGRPDALVVKGDVALVPEAGDLVVHPVDGAQEGRLSRSGRADQRGDGAPAEGDVDVREDRSWPRSPGRGCGSTRRRRADRGRGRAPRARDRSGRTRWVSTAVST